MKRILTVTGHRPSKLGKELYNWRTTESEQYINTFINQIHNYYVDHGELICRSGMALGVDTMFAIAALRLKKRGYNIELECCIPCSNHSSRWLPDSVKVYNQILEHADKITFVSNKPYSPTCMQDRNKYMVNGCDFVLAIWDGTPGGTSNCVSYAKSQGKQINIINPNKII